MILAIKRGRSIEMSEPPSSRVGAAESSSVRCIRLKGSDKEERWARQVCASAGSCCCIDLGKEERTTSIALTASDLTAILCHPESLVRS